MAEEKKEVIKVCPIVSTVEMAIVRNKLDQTTKNVPRFVPMGCIGEACMFFNEEFKQCAVLIQTIMISSIASKYLDLTKKGE